LSTVLQCHCRLGSRNDNILPVSGNAYNNNKLALYQSTRIIHHSMLAPRKKLWSTPSSVVNFCLEFIPLKPKDCVLDIGCGDGRILLQWAEMISHSTFMNWSIRDPIRMESPSIKLNFLVMHRPLAAIILESPISNKLQPNEWSTCDLYR
jgi:hypothetical protein